MSAYECGFEILSNDDRVLAQGAPKKVWITSEVTYVSKIDNTSFRVDLRERVIEIRNPTSSHPVYKVIKT